MVATTNKPRIACGRNGFMLEPEQYEKMLAMAYDQCTHQMISNVLEVDYDSLKRNYGREITAKRAQGKADLLHTQREMAKKNPVMAIFLGKNHLGQADKQDKPDISVTIEHKSFNEQTLRALCDDQHNKDSDTSCTNNANNKDVGDTRRNPTEAQETRENTINEPTN